MVKELKEVAKQTDTLTSDPQVKMIESSKIDVLNSDSSGPMASSREKIKEQAKSLLLKLPAPLCYFLDSEKAKHVITASKVVGCIILLHPNHRRSGGSQARDVGNEKKEKGFFPVYI